MKYGTFQGVQDGRGPMCWNTEYGCTTTQKAVGVVFAILLLICIMGLVKER